MTGAERRALPPLVVGEEYSGHCVVWKGEYGFLRVTSRADIFAPLRSLHGLTYLEPGQRVLFEARMGRDGRLYADNVRARVWDLSHRQRQ